MRFLVRVNQLCYGCGLKASYGKNKLLVTYPPLLKQLYPDHVTNITLYGRLLNNKTIVNVDTSLNYDAEV